ncbi:hypothetical protein MASR1M60_26370 [Rhodocyclaceae bacterium]
MNTEYLPKSASIEVACKWLHEQTNSDWTLARLLECGLMPWVWLDYSPDAPAGIFGDRAEGYFAPIIFAGDTHRLEMYGDDVVVTWTETHDGTLFRATPGMRFSISELRFVREDLQQLAESTKVGAGGTAEGEQAKSQNSDSPQERRAKAAQSARGVRQEILNHWDDIVKAHGEYPDRAQVTRFINRFRDKSEKPAGVKGVGSRLSELRGEKLIP